MDRRRVQCFCAFCCSVQCRRVSEDGAAGTVSGDCPCHFVRIHFLHDFSELPFRVCGDPSCFGMNGSSTFSRCCRRQLRFCHIVFPVVVFSTLFGVSFEHDSVTGPSLSVCSSSESSKFGMSSLSATVTAPSDVRRSGDIKNWTDSMTSNDSSTNVLLSMSTESTVTSSVLVSSKLSSLVDTSNSRETSHTGTVGRTSV